MQDLDMYSSDSLIKELMSRSDSFLLLIELPNEDKPDEMEYEFLYKGDKEWMLKRVQREIIPKIEDDIDEEENEDDD